MKSIHYLATYACDVCGEVFSRKDSMLRHKGSMHGYESEVTFEFECGQCSKKFSRKDNLERHLKSSSNPDGTLKNQCSKCDETFCSVKLMRDHIKSAHTELSCEDCSEKFTHKKSLDFHKMTKNAVSCDECDKMLCNQVSLTRHKHNAHNSVKCEECGFVYKKIYIQYHKLWEHQHKKS